MSVLLSKEQLETIASQLSCPSGELGLKTAENMAANNSGMIQAAIESLSIKDGDAILEIGMGSGSHIERVMQCAESLKYQGVDISELMVEESIRSNKARVESGNVAFILSDGQELPFDQAVFDKIITVNTLYFWNDPLSYAREIRRVLKADGVFSLCFAPKAFMINLPFTQYGFTLYTLEDAENLLKQAGFDLINSLIHNELVKIGPEESIEREFITLTAQTK